MSDPLEPGDPERLDEYLLAGRLGAGGQGVVYDAYAADGTRVAIKVLHLTGGSPSLARLAKEVAAVQRVAPFCTAGILQARLQAGRPYIVTEFIDGMSLDKAVFERGRRFTGDDLHRLAIGIMTALTAVHEAGVVHRDLKPGNILLGPDGPRVIDFGLARSVEMSLTVEGVLAGTPAYMAPEVFQGQRAGASADVFAWGAIILFAFTGDDVFAAGSLSEVEYRVRNAHPDLAVLPTSLQELVGAAMAKDPLARPSARSILAALTGDPCDDSPGLMAAGAHQASLLVRWEPVDPALSLVADSAYDGLTPEDQSLVPEVFLRLVTIEDNDRISVRDLPRDELLDRSHALEVQAFQRILAAFNELLTDTGNTIILARPAVVRAWPLLRGWLDHCRQELLVHQQIRRTATEWDGHGRRPADTLRGRKLDESLSWLTADRSLITMNRLEREFLDASSSLQNRAGRIRRAVTIVLAVSLVVALTSVGLTLRAQHDTEQQRDLAVSGQLAAQSRLESESNPPLAARLALAAGRIHPGPEVQTSIDALLSRPNRGNLTGHDASVQMVAFSPDGGLLISGDDEGRILLRDAATHQSRGELRTAAAGTPVYAMALSPDGATVAVGDTQGTLQFWDVIGRRSLGTFPGRFGAFTALAFSPDGRTLAGADNVGNISLWDVQGRLKPAVLAKGEALEFVSSLTFSPNGRVLSAGGGTMDPEKQEYRDGWVRLWDVTSRRPLGRPLTGHTDLVHDVAISPDGQTVASAGRDGTRLWDFTTARQLAHLPTGPAFALKFSPNGRTLAIGGVRVSLWDPATYRKLGSPLKGHNDNVSALSFAPDERTLATGGEDHTVRLWDVTVNRQLGVPLTGHTKEVRTLAFSPSGRFLATGGDDGTVRLWDVTSRRQLGRPLTRYDGDVLAVVFSPNGRTLAAGGSNGRLALWDLSESRVIGPRFSEPVDIISSMVFSPDGTTLATGAGRHSTVSLRNPTTGQLASKLRTYSAETSSVIAYSPDGRFLASGGYANIRLWDLTENPPPGLLLDNTTVSAMAFTPDSRILLTGNASSLTWWRTTTHEQLASLSGEVSSINVSPDGTTVVTSSRADGMVRLWRTRARTQIGEPLAIEDSGPAAFSPDGMKMAIASGTGVQLWGIGLPADPKATLCRIAGRPLNPQEWSQYAPFQSYQKTCP